MRHLRTSGVCERFHKIFLNEFCQIAFHRKLYHPFEELQTDLDAWRDEYDIERTHQAKMCCGRTHMQTLLEGKTIWMEKVGQLDLDIRPIKMDLLSDQA